jgi:acyl-CoA thioester hydrolase
MTQPLGIEVWRGGVNTWECDWMGHFNVRFYVAALEESLASLAAQLGMEEAFAVSAGATLLVRDHHIRFHREARAGDLIYMTAGALEMDETDARFLFVLWHQKDHQPCASFLVRVSHVTARDERPFPWPALAREKAGSLKVDPPVYAAARSVTEAPLGAGASLKRADELGLMRLTSGVIMPRDADAFGRMNSQVFIGRVSDGVAGLVGDFRRAVAEHAEPKPARVGGAVLENRLSYFRMPRVGDRFEIRSGTSALDGRTMALFHWLLDPRTGEAWGAASAVAIVLDLDARKIIPVSPAADAVLRPKLIAAAGL